jgi:hypothetical protein
MKEDSHFSDLVPSCRSPFLILGWSQRLVLSKSEAIGNKTEVPREFDPYHLHRNRNLCLPLAQIFVIPMPRGGDPNAELY